MGMRILVGVNKCVREIIVIINGKSDLFGDDKLKPNIHSTFQQFYANIYSRYFCIMYFLCQIQDWNAADVGCGHIALCVCLFIFGVRS